MTNWVCLTCQDAVQAKALQEGQPVDALLLVTAQLHLQGQAGGWGQGAVQGGLQLPLWRGRWLAARLQHKTL